MIKDFKSKALRKFYETGDASKLPVQNHDRVRRILVRLDEAVVPEDMNFPGWKFHSLEGKPTRYSVWVTGNYRITFGFERENALDVDILDYH